MTPLPLYRQIYERYQLGPASHMTHVENLEGIFAQGALQSFNSVQGRSYRNISNSDVQVGRAGILVPSSGRPLHDYVPLYFGWRTPMVAVNRDKNDELVFLRFSLELLEIPGTVFTDGNARAGATRFWPFRNITDLTHVDPRTINSLKYLVDAELKRKKQAEILIPDQLGTGQIFDIICHSEVTRTHILAVLERYGKNIRVLVNRAWYFHPPAPEGTPQS